MNDLQSRLNDRKKIPLKGAVVGSAGVGKSTFVNTLRMMHASDSRAAKTGVNHTTTTPTPYEHADFPNVTFWDIPGTGTKEFPIETYLKQIKYDTYDFFIIMSASRITVNDIWLAKEIQGAGKHFYFLRSKTDIDVRNNKEDNPQKHNEELLLKEMRDDCIDQLEKAGIKNPSVFLVCKNPELYDFEEFKSKVVAHLAELKAAAGIVAADLTEDVPQRFKDFASDIKTKNLGVTEIKKELRRMLDDWETIPLDIAVIGNTGVGKSTLINTLRRIHPSDTRAAKTGVMQTTKTPTPYEHSDFPNVKFWDVPGVGTEDFPRKTYLTQIKYGKYDYFIIMIASRFTENDVWLAQEIRRAGKHFYFLRSKIDIDVRNDKEDHPQTHDEEKLLNDMRDDCIKQLEEAGIKNPSVFLVCKYPERYDFKTFEMKAVTDLPELKGEKLLYSARTNSKERIELITKKLKKRSWLLAIASAGVAAIPIPGTSIAFDIGVILAELAFYKKQYRLDDEGLREQCRAGSGSEQVLLNAKKKYFWFTLTASTVARALAAAGVAVVGIVLEETLKYVPVIGTAVSAVLSFASTKLFLRSAIASMEKTALDLHEAAFEKLPQHQAEPYVA